MEPDLDSLAWRAVELAVQRRHDPRLLVATRRSVPGPNATARLIAGLCNAADGRRVLVAFGIDGHQIVGVEQAPAQGWLESVTSRFPGVVPDLSVAVIDADGAQIVVVTARDTEALVVAPRGDRVVIPWFDGELSDHPPAGVAAAPTADRRSSAGVRVRSGWIERTTASDAGALVVWRGIVELGLALPVGADHLGRIDPPILLHDDAATATLLAADTAAAISLDAQFHPSATPGDATRSERGLMVDPTARCRIYLATAALMRDGTADRTEADPALPAPLRLLISLHLPGGDHRAATMATLRQTPPTPASHIERWTLGEQATGADQQP